MFKVSEEAEKHRYTEAFGHLPPTKHGDNHGLFRIPFKSMTLNVIACGAAGISDGWEHVSVSLQNRTPNWAEMDHIKDLFWEAEDTVQQFHVPKKEHVNLHPNCLHLWRKDGAVVELPPQRCV